LAAFVLADWFGQLAGDNATAARAVAVGTFATVGLYQLSPLKFRCLSHCRTPLGHLIHYLGFIVATAVVARQPFAQTTVALTIASVAAWTATVAWRQAGDMGAMPGTMGMNAISFVAMWGLMMAAMMLPSVGPFIGVYQRTVTQNRVRRLTGLAVGYLGVWTSFGLAAFVLAHWFGQLAGNNATVARAVAVGTFATVGLYQLSPLKFRCLSHCRTPLGHLIHYLGFKGTLRDLRAGASHGWFCLGCCWALMVLMVAFGVMNVAAMIGLAVIIAVEKIWRHGERFARVVGVAVIAYAAALIFMPELAPGLDPGGVMAMNDVGM
jgi:predicted metal-binding membrane protein